MTACICCLYLYRRRPRAPLGEAAAQAQQQQLVASTARLLDPRICAGPDMSDTERKLSRTRFSTFDWTSTIRKPGSIMALVLQTPRWLLPTLAALDSIGERRPAGIELPTVQGAFFLSVAHGPVQGMCLSMSHALGAMG